MNQSKTPRDYSEISLAIRRAETSLYELATRANFADALAQAEIIRQAAAEMVECMNAKMGKTSPASESSGQETAAGIARIARWDAYNSESAPVMSHQATVSNQLEKTGQIYIDLAPATPTENDTDNDISPAVAIEIQSLMSML